MKRLAALAFCFLAATGCKTKEKFPSLGTNIASPIDVAVSEDGSHFYVLNADFDRTYDGGSVLVMDKDGNKIGAVPTPRMGRSITVAGNDMIVTIDYADENTDAHVLLFDITDTANPVQKADFPIECSPFNAVAEKGYPYFFVGCMSGALYSGQFADPREGSQLKKVREFGASRRAMVLDTKRGLLLGFTTDTSKQLTADLELEDKKSFDPLNNEILVNDQPVSNDVPDKYEANKRVAANKNQRQLYQFFVYDIDKEKSGAPGCTVTEEENCNFPLRQNSDPIVDAELRWIYYRLNNFDGTPDPSPNELLADQGVKYYRTNFYEAKKDPDDTDVFYLSHRGNPDKSPLSNQIVRVRITGDLRANDKLVAPHTSDVMSFERVYGFKGDQATRYVFPGDFEITQIAGQKTIVVNNFRDLINWVRSDTYFSLGAQVLDDPTWFASTSDPENSDSSSPFSSYYQVAVTPEGKAMSCSFYGNAVLLLDVRPGIGISEPKRIE